MPWGKLKHIFFSSLFWVVALSMFELAVSLKRIIDNKIDEKLVRTRYFIQILASIFFILYTLFTLLPVFNEVYNLIVIVMAAIVTIVASLAISMFLQ